MGAAFSCPRRWRKDHNCEADNASVVEDGCVHQLSNTDNAQQFALVTKGKPLSPFTHILLPKPIDSLLNAAAKHGLSLPAEPKFSR